MNNYKLINYVYIYIIMYIYIMYVYYSIYIYCDIHTYVTYKLQLHNTLGGWRVEAGIPILDQSWGVL